MPLPHRFFSGIGQDRWPTENSQILNHAVTPDQRLQNYRSLYPHLPREHGIVRLDRSGDDVGGRTTGDAGSLCRRSGNLGYSLSRVTNYGGRALSGGGRTLQVDVDRVRSGAHGSMGITRYDLDLKGRKYRPGSYYSRAGARRIAVDWRILRRNFVM